MASSTTDVIEFGEDSESSTSSVLAKLEIDPEYHSDDDGNVESSVSPDETAYYLFHAEPGVRLTALADTIGGTCEIGSTVSRSDEYDAYFESDDTEIELPYYPSGGLSVTWDGLESSLIQDEDEPRKVSCSDTPRRCTISYNYQATSVSHTLPGSVEVGEDEEREINLRAEYEYTESD